MKRKAVVRLLAGTLCTATMAGSILPDTSVAYAKENPVGTVETATTGRNIGYSIGSR